MRQLLFEQQIHVVSNEFVEKALADCPVEEGNRLAIFVGHYLGFISNLVTAAPSESPILSSVLQILLNSEPF